MTTMVEKVAQYLCKADGRSPAEWGNYVRAAQVTIVEIKEDARKVYERVLIRAREANNAD